MKTYSLVLMATLIIFGILLLPLCPLFHATGENFNLCGATLVLKYILLITALLTVAGLTGWALWLTHLHSINEAERIERIEERNHQKDLLEKSKIQPAVKPENTITEKEKLEFLKEFLKTGNQKETAESKQAAERIWKELGDKLKQFVDEVFKKNG